MKNKIVTVGMKHKKGTLKLRGYAKFLRKFIIPYIPKRITIDDCKRAEYAFVTICRLKDFDMVYASLYSLFKYSSVLPKDIIIISDGSWEPEMAKEYFKRYNITVIALTWKTCADFYKESCPQLVKWAYNHIWGKKMAAILYLSEDRKVLFSDPDILWYGSPMSKEEILNTKYKVAIDNTTSYDQKCIEHLGLKILNERTPINCGVVFISGGLGILNKEALACIDYQGDNCGPFAEQTVFAALDLKFDNRWPMKAITSEIDDMYNIFTPKPHIYYPNMVARHYLYMLKWIYWKEYLKMLLK